MVVRHVCSSMNLDMDFDVINFIDTYFTVRFCRAI